MQWKFSNIYSVGVSSYGDRRGIEQFVTDARVALQVLTIIIKFNAFLRGKNRSGSLSVNEAKRTRPRQSYLWNNRAALGVVVAAPFTSPHDEVNHGNAIDFGITMPDGSNRALYDDEWDTLHALVAAHGGDWTGRWFNEKWHHEMATVAEEQAPFPDARQRLIGTPKPAVKPSKPKPAPKPPTPKREVDMLYVFSTKSKTYYGIGETTVQKYSKSRAQTYSKAVPGDTSLFQELSSAQVAGLIQDARDRRDDLGLNLSQTITAALAAEDKAAA